MSTKNETVEASEPKPTSEQVLLDENTGEPMHNLETMTSKQVIDAVKAGTLLREEALIYENQKRDKPREEVLKALGG